MAVGVGRGRYSGVSKTGLDYFAFLLTPATYAVRWSSNHRLRELGYGSMELELTTIVALLPFEERNAIKAELATRYFGGADSSALSLDIEGRLARFRSKAPSKNEDDAGDDAE